MANLRVKAKRDFGRIPADRAGDHQQGTTVENAAPRAGCAFSNTITDSDPQKSDINVGNGQDPPDASAVNNRCVRTGAENLQTNADG